MKNKTKYLWLMLLAFIGYSLGLWALNLFYDQNSAYKYLLILLPMLPTFYIVTISLRAVSETDEMQRKIVTEAMTFSALATALTCFTYSFLRDMGAPEFKAWWAFGLINAYYLLGLVWLKWRYR
ncbi:MAG: hypothetical protein LV480_04465 [Methylacidiphilales bacterium]|nr:hypothetical protein [Candidatus Methylacidiphilales bacterium]